MVLGRCPFLHVEHIYEEGRSDHYLYECRALEDPYVILNGPEDCEGCDQDNV